MSKGCEILVCGTALPAGLRCRLHEILTVAVPICHGDKHIVIFLLPRLLWVYSLIKFAVCHHKNAVSYFYSSVRTSLVIAMRHTFVKLQQMFFFLFCVRNETQTGVETAFLSIRNFVLYQIGALNYQILIN